MFVNIALTFYKVIRAFLISNFFAFNVTNFMPLIYKAIKMRAYQIVNRNIVFENFSLIYLRKITLMCF